MKKRFVYSAKIPKKFNYGRFIMPEIIESGFSIKRNRLTRGQLIGR